jgi:hypothetical protein
VNFQNKIPIRILHVLEANISENTGIVDEDVNTAEIADGSLNDLVTKLDAVVVGDSFTSCLLDFVDDNISGLENEQVNIHVKFRKFNDTAPKLSTELKERSTGILTLLEVPSPLIPPPRSLTTTFAPLEP